MTKQKLKHTAIVAVVLIAALAACATLALHLATKALKTQVQQALGSEAEVGEIVVGWSSVSMHGVRIHAPKDWPAEDTLRAASVVVTPDLKALISSKLSVSRIEIEQPYISILRSREGHVRLLPSLLEKAGKPADPGSGTAKSAEIGIGQIEIRGGVVEFFDASIKQPPHKIRIEQLQASVDDLHVPNVAGHTGIHLEGKIKGVQRDGKLKIDGWVDIVGKNSEISTTLRGVDLIALQPYLIKAAETGVRRGTLDLDLNSTVRDNRLNAPGKVTLTGLELESGSGAMSTFMGVPRKAVIASLKNRNDQIVVPFTLQGNLNDPHFSLNESLAAHIGSGVASALGISIEGLAHGVGSAAQGVQGVVKKLFGK